MSSGKREDNLGRICEALRVPAPRLHAGTRSWRRHIARPKPRVATNGKTGAPRSMATRNALGLYFLDKYLRYLEQGADIVPSRTVVREWEQPRRVAASQRGKQLRLAIERLKQLIVAYRNHDLPQRFLT
jgi:hypothetical protein